MSTDEFETSLRASLQTISVRHDDARVDEMLAAATIGAPLPARRAVLAPVAVAAAVAAIGATAALAATHGDDGRANNQAGGPSAAQTPTPTETVPVHVTYTITAPRSGGKFTAGVASGAHEVPGGRSHPGSTGQLVLDDPLTVSRVVIENPRGDLAAVRVGDGTRPVLTENMAGRNRAEATFDPPTTIDQLRPVIQCRTPGVGDRCRIIIRITATQHLEPAVHGSVYPLPTATGSSSTLPVTPPASCPGCETP